MIGTYVPTMAETLKYEVRAEIQEKLKERISELKAMNMQIENLSRSLDSYRELKLKLESDLMDLQSGYTGKGADKKNLAAISSLEMRCQAIDKTSEFLTRKIEETQTVREKMLKETHNAATTVFNEIKARFEKDIEAEGDKFLNRLEAVKSALKSATLINDYIPEFKDSSASVPNLYFYRIKLSQLFKAWV